jgi:hypothetical protein
MPFVVRSVGGVVFCGSILLEACLLRFGLLGVSSFAVRSFQRRAFCGSVRWGCRLLRFDPFGGVPFAVWSVGGVSFAVRLVKVAVCVFLSNFGAAAKDARQTSWVKGLISPF